jgi:2-polyprenyl-3-methyl-5-hydroxy-6-metoxy-1,4-benzoquinol methylase
MKAEYIKYLICPKCDGDLVIKQIFKESSDYIESGLITCRKCSASYEIINNIPRFVPKENYASSFGLEWNIHSKTQYDSYSGLNCSEKRFFEETGWPRNLKGEMILEIGSGSGRFTEQAASTGAFVISADYSNAVEANYKSNGGKKNVFIIQADIYSLPFRKRFFDKLFCIGVIQHTPDPHKAFMTLPQYLKKNGNLVIDVYKKTPSAYLAAKYYVRFFTKNMEANKLYRCTKKYVDFMWPIANIIRRIPKIGPKINWALCIADYSQIGLKDEMLKEWAYLDTFDMLSPCYDYPQTLKTVKKWFQDAGLSDVDAHYGYNGIEARGTKKLE